ncbi:hypothetical protein CH76_02100 [Lysinibacillus sp. BF-4]|uniref:hypothetical protein n=1 Tax=Lysinibacillus sp. BF-4 TaxID=1473546 RepID=UPI000500417F|nr:hypothetical protein [Lysinibacillus sp. BF-4]KFL44610.1 hypothetical protein CH76_02100 [Lysinibacillus sp. BF-4]
MSEIKSAMLLMIFFVAILFPGILQFGIDSLNQNAFTKNTKEFTELVQEEAGLTSKSKEVKARLETKGYEVKLTDQQGTTVTGTVPYGSTINLAYRYTFKSVFKERVLKSTNTALVTKRDEKTSTGGGKPITPGEDSGNTGRSETKTIILTSDELKSANQTQTFTVDDLGKVKRISSDTGNAEILRINGNQVTVKMTGGATSRQIQTGGEYVEGESKYVTNQTSQVYKDKAGFEGVLNKYVASGYLMQGREKFVTAQYGRFYRDAEGYEGDLAAYLYSGELKPGGSKYVTGQTSSNYSDSQGYQGTLTSYLYSGSYTPAQVVTKSDSKVVNSWMLTTSGKHCSMYKSFSQYKNEILNESHSTISNFVGKQVESFYYTGWESPPKETEERCDVSFRLHYSYKEQSPAKDTRVYRYQGTVNKPSVDTRVYRYQGVVKQPDTDMREWRYQGTVRKTGMDTRTFDKYYQYNLELTYEVKE